MANPLRPSPLSFDSGRQSPFKRQNSSSPGPPRAATLTQSPTKPASGLSPTKAGSLSPEKTSPFVRRPSQISQTSERPSSPFARPTSSLSIPASPTRQSSNTSTSDDRIGLPSQRTASPEAIDVPSPSNLTIRAAPSSPSPFDGPSSPTPEPRSLPFASQANLRPTLPRTTTSSTTSTIRPPTFMSPAPITQAPARAPLKAFNTGGGTAYKNIPPQLLHSMRESFEVLDSSNSGAVSSASVASTLEQMGLPNNPAELRDFFPPNGPSQLNLARYLDTLSGPLSELSSTEELSAAFSAFDVDDSGQIDVADLRRSLLSTAPEDGARMSERELDGILGEFSGRRAFGAKGLNVAKGKGEVFRWREFMGAVSGGGGMGAEGVMAA